MSDCSNCQRLADELERIRHQATVDFQSLQSDVIGKNREIGRLKGLIVKQDDDSPENQRVRELLELWRDQIRGEQRGPKPNISADSTRAQRVRWAIKNYGVERTKHAILGCRFDDWAMGRINKTGGKSFNDLAKHILRDVETFERFEKLYLDNIQPTLEQPPLLDERRVENAVQKGLENHYKAKLDAEDRDRDRAVRAVKFGDGLTPMERVTSALQRVGSEMQVYAAHPDGMRAQCPAHHGENKSALVVRRDPDGKLWIKCWAGCSKEAILDALGLQWTDLWENSENDPLAQNYVEPYRRNQTPRQAELQETLRLIGSTLREWERAA